MRPHFFSACFCSFLPLLCAAQNREPAQEVPPEQVERTVLKATNWLLTTQRSSGGFSEWDRQDWVKPDSINPPEHSGALTALAIMGLSSVGHQPSDPTPEGMAMRKALDYMLHDKLQEKEGSEAGYLGRRDSSRMYGHGIMALMFAEMVGMGATEEQDRKIRDRLNKAVQMTLRSQNQPKDEWQKGGWRYEPDSRDSDLSVTVWHLMALRAAKNSAVDVPKDAIDRAVTYVKKCYSGKRDEQGNLKETDVPFRYQISGGEAQFSTTAAGVLSLQVCGAYDAPEVTAGANYLLKSPPKRDQNWFFYGMYYYSQGMYQRGGEYADTARIYVSKTLGELQKEEGYWDPNSGEKGAGKIYATAMSLLSLSVHYHFLPIYQK